MSSNKNYAASILVIDDEKNIRQSIAMILEQENFRVWQSHDGATALRVLSEEIIDIILLDIKLTDIDGLHLFKRLKKDGLQVPTIFMSGHASLSEAAEAVKLGGYDFIEKPFNFEKLLTTIKRCLEYTLVRQQIQLMGELKDQYQILGDHWLVQQALNTARKAAVTEASVLIQGESGTGKELFAHLIHHESPRRTNNFVKVNCSAIPDTLIESELFGHEKGAFTHAQYAKRGLFELAHRGTIFLDEIADLSLAAQAKILRVLQNGEIQKVGAEKSLQLDVRVIAASHKNLKYEIQKGHFREDLFFRLNVIPLQIPALRDRIDDLNTLVPYFIERLAHKNNLKSKTFSDDFLEALQEYSWPGNIRELQNLLERLLILGSSPLGIEDLPEDYRTTNDRPEPIVNSLTQKMPLKEFRDRAERQHIIAILKMHNGNISQSAATLNVGRTYLHKRLEVLEISKQDYF